MQGIKFIEVKGSCMMPLLCEKTLVAFKPATPSDIMPQDIAVFKIKGIYMVHRIISKFQIRGKLFFIHKGDTGKIPLVAPSCALVGKAILEHAYYRRPKRIRFILALKIMLIKFKLWAKLSTTRA